MKAAGFKQKVGSDAHLNQETHCGRDIALRYPRPRSSGRNRCAAERGADGAARRPYQGFGTHRASSSEKSLRKTKGRGERSSFLFMGHPSRILFLGILAVLSPGLSRAGDSLFESNTTFAFDLYSQLKTKEGNLFFSPYSISTCLAMTYAGARGDTEKQMAAVLHFNQKPDGVHSAFGTLQRQLNDAGTRKGVELSIANALWAQKGHPFRQEFVKAALVQSRAKLNQVDFTTQADAATEEINRWVAEKTKNKIQDVVAPGSLDASARLALVNAIYFKGEWVKRFDKLATSPQPFHINKTRAPDVPLMYQTEKVRYVEDSTIQAVELPYEGNQLSMVILLPKDIEGCAKLEGLLNLRNLSTWLKAMRSQKVLLYVPKFKMESSFNLSAELKQMGMGDAFGPKADFSGMDGTSNLFISTLLHKAWVEVTEEGTEAAAATVVALTLSAAEPEPMPPVFRADHPFIFLIRHNRSGSILFLGRVADPTQ